MQTYRCTCRNRIFFENTCCLVCQREIGWCEACSRMTSLQPAGDAELSLPNSILCGHADCRQPLRKCHNYLVENACNRCYVPETDAHTNAGESAPAANPVPQLCSACRLTETIPDRSVAGNREKWARLEAAKRRLLYTLDRLGLPYLDAEPKLSFDFKADVERPNNEWRSAGQKEIVY